MEVEDKLNRLIEMGEEVLSTRFPSRFSITPTDLVDKELFHRWRRRAEQYLLANFSNDSSYLQDFRQECGHNAASGVSDALSILKEIKEAFESGEAPETVSDNRGGISIDGSTIGLLNAGEIFKVNSISSTVNRESRQREQLDEFRKLIVEIDYALSYYASAYSNPGLSNEKDTEEAQKELRRLASKLKASFNAIPSELRVQEKLPSKEDVLNASGKLNQLMHAISDKEFLSEKGIEITLENPRTIRRLLLINDTSASEVEQTPDSDGFESLIRQLKDSNRRHDACKALIKFGVLAVPGLIKALHNEKWNALNWKFGWYVAEALGSIGDPAAVPALIEVLDNENVSVRVRGYVTDTLQKIGTPEALEAVEKWRKAQSSESEANEIDSIEDAVEEDNTISQHTKDLLGQLKYGDMYARKNAAMTFRSMAQQGENLKPVLPKLIEALDDTDDGVYQFITDALGYMGENAVDAVPKLIQKLNPMELTRAPKAASVLRKIGTSEAFQAVEKWEREKGRSVSVNLNQAASVPIMEMKIQRKENTYPQLPISVNSWEITLENTGTAKANDVVLDIEIPTDMKHSTEGLQEHKPELSNNSRYTHDLECY